MFSNGSVFGNLTSKVNRELDVADIENSQGSAIVSRPAHFSSDMEFILALFAADKAYGDDIRYTLYPEQSKDGRNSNSYISGILKKVGAVPPSVPGAPGYDVPIGGSYFRGGTSGSKIYDINGREVDQNVTCTGSRVKRTSC